MNIDRISKSGIPTLPCHLDHHRHSQRHRRRRVVDLKQPIHSMSGLSSYFPAKFIPTSTNPNRDRPPAASSSGKSSDPLSHLRFVLETLPGSRKYVFTPATRAEILSELYDAFWGPYAHLFLPNSNSSLPLHATLSEVQVSLGFSGAGKEQIVPGRPCGHIFKKGESCFRCKLSKSDYTIAARIN